LPASHPAQLHELCQNAFNAANDEALAALYEEEAVFVTSPGTSITGRAAIRKAYVSFGAMKPVMRLETASVVQNGDLALLEGKWVLIGASPEGDPIHITGTSHEVVRRQPDGTWLYAIDDPGAGT
jgi:uncharacterized protein (TIGR02246 family)